MMGKKVVRCVFALSLWLLLCHSAHSQEASGVVWKINLPTAQTPMARWLSANSYIHTKGDISRWQVGDGVLYMEAVDDSCEIDVQFPAPIPMVPPKKMVMTYQVASAPQGADMRKAELQDSAFRVYVGFDKLVKQYLFGLIPKQIPNSLVYAHGTGERKGDEFQAPRFSNIFFHVVSDGTGKEWITVERDLGADYQRHFGAAPPPPIIGLKIKIDSNNTHGASRARLKTLEIRERH